MTVKIVSIDSNGTEREVGTASKLDLERRTFPDPEAVKYPFIVSTPRTQESRVVLHDFSGRPDPSLYGGIYRELRTENRDLRRQIEALEVSIAKANTKLSNQQKNFEDFTAGQANARHIRKEGEKALKQNESLRKDNEYLKGVVEADQETITSLEGKLVSARNTADHWYAEWSALLARTDGGEHLVDSSVVQEYEERIDSLTRDLKFQSDRAEKWRRWHLEDTSTLRGERDTALEQLAEAQDAIAKLLEGFNDGLEAMDAAASEWNAFVDSEVAA